jgi:hypothetical protein
MLQRPDIDHILRAAFQSGIADAQRVAALLRADLPDTAPDISELERRLAGLVGA